MTEEEIKKICTVLEQCRTNINSIKEYFKEEDIIKNLFESNINLLYVIKEIKLLREKI